MNTPASETTNGAGSPARRRGLLILAVAVLLGAAAWAVYWFGYARWRVSTDDAYVGGNVVQVTAEVPGTVREIRTRETESVAAGQTLLLLDPADAKVAMDAAVADLGSTVRQVEGTYAQVDRLRAQVAVRQVELDRARKDLARRDSIADGGAVSAEDVSHARENVAALEAALRAAQEDLKAALSQTVGTTPEEHPLVLRAAARVRDAALTLQRMTIVAPVGGVVGKKGVQIGQRVAPGTPLIGIVPLQDVWVDANFKEVQLEEMRIGQPVDLRADLYGRSVAFKGHIVGMSPGTGAAFALLPAQNASGNWIKIVQRVPVRIALDADEIAKHPLRIGLSMRVVVDVHDQSGPVLTQPSGGVAAEIEARSSSDPATEALIARTIAVNSGREPGAE
ncbi:MAG TPA: HlyD family efflux transporter periplasmic adaptor subunit [Burkholderiaceae bacterium]|nr:HlyD family efflux transporter periplasmic adaptor subunit [Burkholderiaceae bacterium]